MEIGIHLPQTGPLAGPDAIARAARHAEELGFADLWVWDQTVQPAGEGYRSARCYDPIVTLTWAAAHTERIGLGTGVLAVPRHNPVELAHALASLDSLSNGRLTVGVGVGWQRGEFAALGYDFTDRGRRTDEVLKLWRALWEQDPVSFAGEHHRLEEVRALPQPAHRIPLWVGGGGEAAYRRAVSLGDGLHLIGVPPEDIPEPRDRVRAVRPGDDFVLSLCIGWDPLGMDPRRISEETGAYAEVGVDHVVAAPWRTTVDDWLRTTEQLAELTGLRAR